MGGTLPRRISSAPTDLLTRKRDEWIALGRSASGPACMDAAKRAISAGYAEAGKAPPRVWLHLRGPLHGALASGLLSSSAQVSTQVSDQVLAHVLAQVRDQVSAQVLDQVRDQVRDQVSAQVSAQVLAQVSDHVSAQVLDQVRDQVRDQVLAHVLAQVRDQVRDINWQWPNNWGGQDGWYWSLAYYDTMRELGVDACARVQPWIDAARATGCCWLYWDVAIITDRPTTLLVDARGRLHGESGPAVEYADGLQVWAWHGTRVPAEWIRERETLRAADVLIAANVEQRRAGCEVLGWDRVLSELPHRVIDEDSDPQIGTLLVVDLPQAPGSAFLRVRCATGRTFALPVDPACTTALEANAWTYGIDAAAAGLVRARQART